ncbi:hypothetical protein MWE_1061 [Helicobacter pylori XZ274]|nr:hypothetical protein MWE_1061 [Helicobacter pylori XZ274]
MLGEMLDRFFRSGAFILACFIARLGVLRILSAVSGFFSFSLLSLASLVVSSFSNGVGALSLGGLAPIKGIKGGVLRGILGAFSGVAAWAVVWALVGVFSGFFLESVLSLLIAFICKVSFKGGVFFHY